MTDILDSIRDAIYGEDNIVTTVAEAVEGVTDTVTDFVKEIPGNVNDIISANPGGAILDIFNADAPVGGAISSAVSGAVSAINPTVGRMLGGGQSEAPKPADRPASSYQGMKLQELENRETAAATSPMVDAADLLASRDLQLITEPPEFDTSDLDMEQRYLRQQLFHNRSQQLSQANALFDRQMETYADNPGMQFKIDTARQDAITQIEDNYQASISRADVHYSRVRRAEEATWEQAQQASVTRDLQNEALALDIEATRQSLIPEVGGSFNAPDPNALLDAYNQMTGNTDINESESVFLQALNELSQLYQYGVATGNADALLPPASNPNTGIAEALAALEGDDRAAAEAIANSVWQAAISQVGNLG